MRLEEILNEGLGEYKAIGNFSRNHGFGSADRRLITNPLIQEKLRKRLGHLPYTVNMWFVNDPKASKHVELGLVDLNWIEDNLGKKIAEAVAPYNQQDGHINILFTNNKGQERIPMTPWIMMHRMSHALSKANPYSSYKSNSHQFQDFKRAEDSLVEHVYQIFEAYGYNQFPDRHTELVRDRKAQLAMIALFNNVAKFRSARIKSIRNYFEVINELFAQYMMSGDLQFNPPPTSFMMQLGKGWGAKRYIGIRHDDEHMKNYIENLLESLSESLKNHFNNILEDAARGYLVM